MDLNEFSITYGKKDKIFSAPIPADSALVPFLIVNGNNKKLKLSTADVLLMEQGIRNYNNMSFTIGYTDTPEGLGIKYVEQAEGPLPEAGKTVVVHYKGMLEDGTQFDSSFDRNKPIEFPLGQGRVIKGWDIGIGMLPVGSKAWLRIPPELGYGSRDMGVIPPNSTLYFLVEVVDSK
jgi:FKBP-type peptidyl-prolyl cis-trans isomerase